MKLPDVTHCSEKWNGFKFDVEGSNFTCGGENVRLCIRWCEFVISFDF